MATLIEDINLIQFIWVAMIAYVVDTVGFLRGYRHRPM
jgi:hypothetical protein